MSKAEDLSGMEFGFLKVVRRTDDHVTKSGQKKVRWLCECMLCGKTKSVSSQELKKGSVVSCGCYQSYIGKLRRNKKICIICGKSFECPPSDKKVTCSEKCRKIYAKKRSTGRKLSDEAREKISKKAKERDKSGLLKFQAMAVEAAKNSPKSGRFETNVSAIDWHIVSPEGKHYYFHSLNFWLRENGRELFGCEPDSREFHNVRSGLSGAKRAVLGKKYPCCTYKGWKVIPTDLEN